MKELFIFSDFSYFCQYKQFLKDEKYNSMCFFMYFNTLSDCRFEQLCTKNEISRESNTESDSCQ